MLWAGNFRFKNPENDPLEPNAIQLRLRGLSPVGRGLQASSTSAKITCNCGIYMGRAAICFTASRPKDVALKVVGLSGHLKLQWFILKHQKGFSLSFGAPSNMTLWRSFLQLTTYSFAKRLHSPFSLSNQIFIVIMGTENIMHQ